MKRKGILAVGWVLAIGILAFLTLSPNVMTIEGQSDKMLHVVIFCFLMLVPVLGLKNWRMIAIAAGVLFIVGLGIEILQELSPGRKSSLEDMMANIAGILAGLGIGALLRSDYRHFSKILIIAFLPFAFSAYAQDNVIAASERAQPDYEPLGLRLGTLMVYPEMTLEERWDDNIFKTPAREESDAITVVRPGLRVRTDWNLHELQASVRGNLGFFANNSSENFEDFNAGASGRLDIGHDTYLFASTDYARNHDQRDDPDDVNGDEPTIYNTIRNRAGYVREVARLKLYLMGQHAEWSFDDARRAGIRIDNAGRDRTEYSGDVKLAYELSPHYEMFVRGILRDVDYNRITNGVDRSSSGYELVAGTALNISGKTKGEVYMGTIQRDFGAGLSDVDAFNYGGSLLWNISGLSSLKAEINRSLFETTGAGVSGYLRTRGDVTLEHAFRRNLIAQAGLGYSEDDFIGSARKDETWRAKIGGEYKLNRSIALGLNVRHIDRDSNNAASVYDNNIIMGSVKFTR